MVTLLFTTLQLFHKKISYRTFWCIMNLTQNITKESDPVSADTIHIDIVIRTFHPVSVSSFFIQNNRKITECILLCMFLCKDWLFQIYEYHCPDCLETDTGFLADTAGISVCWWYDGIQIWHKIWKCFKIVWPYRTQRLQLSEWSLLCECHALRARLEWG